MLLLVLQRTTALRCICNHSKGSMFYIKSSFAIHAILQHILHRARCICGHSKQRRGWDISGLEEEKISDGHPPTPDVQALWRMTPGKPPGSKTGTFGIHICHLLHRWPTQSELSKALQSSSQHSKREDSRILSLLWNTTQTFHYKAHFYWVSHSSVVLKLLDAHFLLDKPTHCLRAISRHFFSINKNMEMTSDKSLITRHWQI